MRCACGERIAKSGAKPDEELVLFGRYFILKKGQVHVVCRKCKRENIVKPTLVRLQRSTVRLVDLK